METWLLSAKKLPSTIWARERVRPCKTKPIRISWLEQVKPTGKTSSSTTATRLRTIPLSLMISSNSSIMIRDILKISSTLKANIRSKPMSRTTPSIPTSQTRLINQTIPSRCQAKATNRTLLRCKHRWQHLLK